MNTKEYISSGIIESYILGLASPEEAGILECVMKNNAEVKQAFEDAQKTLEDLATAHAVAPADELKSKILNRIKSEPTVVSPNNNPEIPKHKFETKSVKEVINWKTYGIAASVLFLISILGNFLWINDIADNKKQIVQLQSEKQLQDAALSKMNEKMQLFSNPDMKMVVLKGVEKHPDSKALVFWDTKSKKVYLNADSLPKAPAGMQYQLWAIADGKTVNAGMYTSEKDSKTALANIPNAQAFAITLEKEGGSEVPTMENMFVMGTT